MFEYVLLSPVADGLLGRPYFDYRGQSERWEKAVQEMGFEKALRQNVSDRLDLAVKLGHDLLYVCPNPLPPRKAPAQTVSVPSEGDSDDPVAKVAARNTARRAAAKTIVSNERFLVFEVLKEEMGRRDLNMPLIAPDYVHGIWTDVDLMQTMAMEPEVAHEHFRLCTETALIMARNYASIGISLIGIGGDFAGKHPLISAEMYRTFIMPELRSLTREIHNLGGRSVNTSDGSLWYVMEEFLIRTETDGYMEIDQGAGMELERLKTLYGDRITFIGNIDCGNLLSSGSEDEIRRATIACLEAGLGNGGHIFTASNAITDSVRLRNYLAMVNSYRDFWGLRLISTI